MKSKDFGETVDFPKAQFTEEGPDSKLRFSPRSPSDYGDIVCMATNSNGEGGQPCNYQIKIRGVPLRFSVRSNLEFFLLFQRFHR